MQNGFKNKKFWKEVFFIFIFVCTMLENPNFWKSMFFIYIILSDSLPNIIRCFSTDLSNKYRDILFPPEELQKKGTYDYQNGKLVFKKEDDDENQNQA